MSCNKKTSVTQTTNFNIYYRYQYTDKLNYYETINTFDSSITREYFASILKIDFTFSEKEKRDIYKHLIENNFLLLPDTFFGINQEKLKKDILTIEINGQKKTIIFNSPTLVLDSQDLLRYNRITKAIRNNIDSEYQALFYEPEY